MRPRNGWWTRPSCFAVVAAWSASAAAQQLDGKAIDDLVSNVGDLLRRASFEDGATATREIAFADDFTLPALDTASFETLATFARVKIERARLDGVATKRGSAAIAAWKSLASSGKRSPSVDLHVFSARASAGDALELAGRILVRLEPGRDVAPSDDHEVRSVEIRGVLRVTGGRLSAIAPELVVRVTNEGGGFVDVLPSALREAPEALAQLGLDRIVAEPLLDRRQGGRRGGAGGLTVVDVDRDGRPDLYVSQPGGLPNRLLRNRGDGSFEDRSRESGLDVLDATCGALFEDFDGDRQLDALLFGTGLHLLHGDERGRFEPMEDGGLVLPREFYGVCAAAAAGDVDGDGDLDLFVATHRAAPANPDLAQPWPLFDASNGPANLFFVNEGGGRFRECLVEAGLGPGSHRLSCDARFVDGNGDGVIDLVVANEFGRSQLFQGDGHGRFREDSLLRDGDVVGVARFVSSGDFDGDGRGDLFFGSASNELGARRASLEGAYAMLAPRTRQDLQRTAHGGTLLLRDRDLFRDASQSLGLRDPGPLLGGTSAELFGDARPELLLLGAEAGSLDETAARSPAAKFWDEVLPAIARQGNAHEFAERPPGGSIDAGSRLDCSARLLTNVNPIGFVDLGPVLLSESSPVLGRGPRGADLVRIDSLTGGRAVVAFDCDGDGDQDLAVLASRAESPALRILRNDLDRPRESRERLRTDSYRMPTSRDEWRNVALSLERRVPAPSFELDAVSGRKVKLGEKSERSCLVAIGSARGVKDPVLGSTLSAEGFAERLQDHAASLAELVLLFEDAPEKTPTHDAALAFRALAEHLHESRFDPEIFRIDRDGFVDAFARGDLGMRLLQPEPFLQMQSSGTAGRWLTPPRDDPNGLARAYREAKLPEQALHALLVYQAQGARGLDFEMGLALRDLKRLAEAASSFQHVAAADPDYSMAMLELARCQARLGEQDAARQGYERAARLRPTDAVARFERGRLLLKSESREELEVAADELRIAIYLRPEWVEPRILLGEALLNVGRLDEAELRASEALKLAPENAAALKLDEAIRARRKS